MVTHIMSNVRNYFIERCCIECGKERPKDRSLILCLERFTHTFFNFNHLLSISFHQVWGKPLEGISRVAIPILQQADDSTVRAQIKTWIFWGDCPPPWNFFTGGFLTRRRDCPALFFFWRMFLGCHIKNQIVKCKKIKFCFYFNRQGKCRGQG